jgi:hypothetical protein
LASASFEHSIDWGVRAAALFSAVSATTAALATSDINGAKNIVSAKDEASVGLENFTIYPFSWQFDFVRS